MVLMSSYHERTVPFLSRMAALTLWSTHVKSGMYLALWLTLVMALDVSGASKACPRDVISEANHCLTNYSFHSENMYNSQQKLCCGIDVETLRSFCHSYKNAIFCVEDLKHNCPESTHSSIDQVLVNLDGAKESLIELCFDDRFFERYAMHQNCFMSAGPESEACFHTFLADYGNVQFLSSVDITQQGKFCSTMKKIVSCVQQKVNIRCGPAASRLSVKLIKPMVRKSSQCDYTVIKPKPKKPDSGKHNDADVSYTNNPNRYINDAENGKGHNPSSRKGSNSNNGSGNASNRVASLPLFHTVLCSLMPFVLIELCKHFRRF